MEVKKTKRLRREKERGPPKSLLTQGNISLTLPLSFTLCLCLCLCVDLSSFLFFLPSVACIWELIDGLCTSSDKGAHGPFLQM